MASTAKRVPLQKWQKWQKWISLAALLALVFVISAAGSFVTLPKIPTWYAGLNKPFFSPPNWIFGPVWTTLYVLMAVAAWRVSLRPASRARDRALAAFFIQLALNAFWSPVFFGFEAPLWALAIIVMLLCTLGLTVFRFFGQDRMAGLMLVPYLAWTAFAAVLNTAIVALN